jgi:ATP-binding cassette, subfamily F, member 3
MITARNVTLRRGTNVVLDGASFTLNPGEKAGLVGHNGAGKSSLFSLMAGRLHADHGDVEIPARWQIGEVAQSMPETDDGATTFVLQGDLPLSRAQAELDAAEASGDGHAIANAHVSFEEAGGFDSRSRAQALLLGLGFKTSQLEAPVNSFSGGWRMRLQLARALMCPADLLLLDEPTNHLDLDALVWLEAWLKRYAGTLLIISHDREFLDAITRITLHVDKGSVNRYGGNYTAFESMRAERMLQAGAAFGKQQERIAHLQKFIERFKAKASKAKQAQSRVKALARMEKLAPVLTESDFSFEFREPANLPNPMLVMRDGVCGYKARTADSQSPAQPELDDTGVAGTAAPSADPTQDIAIVRNVTRTVMAGQRIGILGANGQGKSTLVKTIARALPALGGTVTEGKGLSIGYFAQQEMDLLQADDTPLQLMTRIARAPREPGSGGPPAGQDVREQALRNFLGQFRFDGEMVKRAVNTLSGGERARLVLATIVWQRPNLLLLDEPTNHLDLATREALSIALNEFEGTVLLVSHDRALLREVCDEFWLVTRGGVLPFDGDLDDYQRWLLDVSRAAVRGGEPPPVPQGTTAMALAPAPMASNSGAKDNKGKSAGSGSGSGSGSNASASAPVSAAPAAPTVFPREDRKAKAQARQRAADATRTERNELAQIDKRLAALAKEKAET